MDDFPSAIADFLESTAAKVRNLTVDRVRNWATWLAAGVLILVLGLVLVVFLIVGLFRLLASLVGVEVAYLVLGGIFIVAGAFLWSKRLPKTPVRSEATLDSVTEHARSDHA